MNFKKNFIAVIKKTFVSALCLRLTRMRWCFYFFESTRTYSYVNTYTNWRCEIFSSRGGFIGLRMRMSIDN